MCIRDRIIAVDKRDEEPKEVIFHYEGGIKEFVQYLNRSNSALYEDIPVSYTHLDVYKRQTLLPTFLLTDIPILFLSNWFFNTYITK